MSSQAQQLSEQVRSRYCLEPSSLPQATTTLYEGRDTDGTPVLVRVLGEDAFASAAERQRVKRELQKLTQVRHAALASVLDTGEEGSTLWYARERVPGESLAARIERTGALPPSEAAWIAMKTASALAELHRNGVQHRDVRPERVVLVPDGTVKLLDAAVGRVVRLADGRVVPGVPGYVAPEAITGRLVSFRSDLYALGAVLYEMLAGRATFPVADLAQRLQLQLGGDPDALPDTVPESLARFTLSLLAREQRDRPFSAQQVERQLEPFAVPPASSAISSDVGTPEVGERTVAFETSIPPTHAPQPGSAPYDDRADDAPTRLHAGSSEAGTRTLVGMESPGIAAASSGPSGVSQSSPTATGSAFPTGTLNTRFPKMPTLPPIPTGSLRTSSPAIAPAQPLGSLPSLAPAAPAPPPRKATIMGMPMSELQGASMLASAAAPPTPPPKPVAGTSLDYDDLGDTTVNDDSRAFGLPGYPPPTASGETPGVPPRTATALEYMVNGAPQTAVAVPPPPAVVTTPGVGTPETMATVMAPAPPGAVPPTPPAAAMARPSIPEPPPLQPNLPPVFGPKPIPYSEYPPTPPRKQSNTGLWIVAAFGVVLVAGIGGLAAAKLTAERPSETPAAVTVVPPQPVVASPSPHTLAAPSQTAPTAPSTAVAPEAVPSAPPLSPSPSTGTTRPSSTERTTPGLSALSQTPVARTPQPAPSQTPVARTPQPAPSQTPVARTQQSAVPTASAVGANDPRIAEALRTRDYPLARTLLQNALRSQPNNASLHAQLGNVFERLGDRNAALNEYRTATRLDRRNTTYLHRLADLQVATGDRAGAQATLRQILTIAPDDRAAQARLRSLGG